MNDSRLFLCILFAGTLLVAGCHVLDSGEPHLPEAVKLHYGNSMPLPDHIPLELQLSLGEGDAEIGPGFSAIPRLVNQGPDTLALSGRLVDWVVTVQERGEVIIPDLSTPMSSAGMFAVLEPGGSFWTGEEFHFPALPAGRYTVVAYAGFSIEPEPTTYLIQSEPVPLRIRR